MNDIDKEINQFFLSLEKKGMITKNDTISLCKEIVDASAKIYNELENENPFLSQQEKDANIIHAMEQAFTVFKKKHIELTQEAETPDFETLKMYLEYGFTLYGFLQEKDENGKTIAGFCNPFSIANKGKQLKAKGGNFYTLQNGTLKQDKCKIQKVETLKKFLDAGIKNFKFYPGEKGFICFDIDRGHKDGIDGVQMFIGFLKTIKADRKEYFKDIDKGLFPLRTLTPSGGLHLYFKTDFLSKESNKYKNGFCRNVELKYGNLNLTAAGSVKNGIRYTINNKLENAPQLPAYFLEYILDLPKQQTQTQRQDFSSQNNTRQEKKYSLSMLAKFSVEDIEKQLINNEYDKAAIFGKKMLKYGYDKETIKAFLKSYYYTKNFSCIDNVITELEIKKDYSNVSFEQIENWALEHADNTKHGKVLAIAISARNHGKSETDCINFVKKYNHAESDAVVKSVYRKQGV